LNDTQFLADFAAMSAIGATSGGGVEREAGTASDHAVRRWFDSWLRKHGFRREYDGIGNQFGLLEFEPGAPWVLVGSHLDSQPLGGRFDGAYGVLVAAYAAARVAVEARAGTIRPTVNLAVVNWFNEEGSRFTPSMMGSAVFTGKLALNTALATEDLAGVSVAASFADSGMTSDFSLTPVAAYAEIHIEQGRLLEDQQRTIGLVDGTWAASKYQVTVTGEQSHTGSTVMRDRRDALYGASLLIAAAHDLTDFYPEGSLHSSVSQLTVLPNSPVVVAREVSMNLDLRSPDERILSKAMNRLDEFSRSISEQANVRIEHRLTHHWGLLSYDPEGSRLTRSIADDLGLPSMVVKTVAGHDSTNMNSLFPTIMLFVPSVDGVSHNEREHTLDEDSLSGLTMFSELCRRMSRGEFPARSSDGGYPATGRGQRRG
jgi:N-carbamoyl-L-amino-acid hydrolase